MKKYCEICGLISASEKYFFWFGLVLKIDYWQKFGLGNIGRSS